MLCRFLIRLLRLRAQELKLGAARGLNLWAFTPAFPAATSDDFLSLRLNAMLGQLGVLVP